MGATPARTRHPDDSIPHRPYRRVRAVSREAAPRDTIYTQQREQRIRFSVHCGCFIVPEIGEEHVRSFAAGAAAAIGCWWSLESGMSFGLARDRELDDAGIGVREAELPPLPDAVIADREAGRIDPRAWFADPTLPFEIEIGVGKGTFLVNQTTNDRATNYLGIEWAHEFYLYSADRLRRRAATEGLQNVRMLHAGAADYLKWRCPGGIVRVIHLYFSDPWPKHKHHKKRVIQDSFLADAWKVLVAGGELRVVTDHDDLWSWDVEHFNRWAAKDGEGELGVDRSTLVGLSVGRAPFVQRAFTPPEWVVEGELVGTNYERKFKRDDRPAHACVLSKQM